MEFQFKSELTAGDIWKLSMHHIYHSMLGVCNIVFSCALIALTVRFWTPNQEFLMGVLVLCCILFPVMQPIMVYMRAAKQVAALPGDMIIKINDTGVHVSGNNQKDHISWSRIRGIIKEPNMVILAAEAGRGYMLTNKTLGTQKEALLEFVESKIERKS